LTEPEFVELGFESGSFLGDLSTFRLDLASFRLDLTLPAGQLLPLGHQLGLSLRELPALTGQLGPSVFQIALQLAKSLALGLELLLGQFKALPGLGQPGSFFLQGGALGLQTGLLPSNFLSQRLQPLQPAVQLGLTVEQCLAGTVQRRGALVQLSGSALQFGSACRQLVLGQPGPLVEGMFVPPNRLDSLAQDPAPLSPGRAHLFLLQFEPLGQQDPVAASLFQFDLPGSELIGQLAETFAAGGNFHGLSVKLGRPLSQALLSLLVLAGRGLLGLTLELAILLTEILLSTAQLELASSDLREGVADFLHQTVDL